MASALAPSALKFAARSHASQRRDSDGAAFIAHPVEVARLLRDAGCSEELVAAGLLHDVVEDADISVEELTDRFGPDVAGLVRAVSDDGEIEDYRRRKRALREQVREAGGDAALLFAADKISKVREMRVRIARDAATCGPTATLDAAERLRLEHYQNSLAMLRAVMPRHPLVTRLATELTDTRSALGAGARARRRARARRLRRGKSRAGQRARAQ